MAATMVAMHRALCLLAGPSCGSGFERRIVILGVWEMVPLFQIVQVSGDRCHVGSEKMATSMTLQASDPVESCRETMEESCDDAGERFSELWKNPLLSPLEMGTGRHV